MARRTGRAAATLRFEVLEPRTLLNGSATDDLFVRFKPNLSGGTIQTALSTVGATVVEQYPSGPMLISLRAGVDQSRVLQWFQFNPLVSYAEPNSTIQAAAVIPNDPYFNQQWGLNNANNVDIDAPEAWTLTQGRYTTIVAVLDTGIDLNNVELTSRLWVNPGDLSGSDGFRNAIYGWNFVNNNNNVQDTNGHGTHVAGILAASGNNAYGITGVDWYSKIMPVKVLDNRGDGTTESAVNGIYFAVNHGARVINASWGGGAYSQALRDAIAYAAMHGVVFVTAAGNDGLNTDLTPSYPGSYNLNNQITVGAVDSQGRLASFSDYGTRSVDLVAPGVDILSIIPGGFASYSGTSMAAPFVSGVAALVLSLRPDFNAEQVVQRILSTTKPLPGAAGKTVTGGIVDAYNAVNFAANVTSTATEPQGDGIPTTVTLVPNGTSDYDLLAKILATDDFYNGYGGTNTGFVTGLYQTLLGRDPEPAGLASWVGRLNSGQTRIQVIETFERTPEALQVKVAHWYQDTLGWNASLAQLKFDPGVIYWSTLLAAGQTDNAVLARILSTNDYLIASGGTNEGFVTGLYQSLLGRSTDPESFNYFVGLLQGGMSRANLVQKIQNTVEAKRTKVARWYQDHLGWNQSLPQLQLDPGVRYWAGFLGGD
ncbi:S8 family serine peptidase [Singulisphaera acidiphila]|uniref:Subtilisin-like serine protease n=1 Tax=Singulisphaera acidiphila (strain ATCC BAA-1392 / DSM 18658 / VKM B-2454 / MOB10) TaxID=886293 RepID=L0D6R8_SINAD|nr:S8 family serine peptidase [Singulisphaera acidiphila]AGA25104.1 subtilisin-like serine protease [Singulisphaera acidiphila DSM 18658]